MDSTHRLADAADITGLTVPQLLRLCADGDLELRRVGPHQALRITRASVKRYLRRNAVP